MNESDRQLLKDIRDRLDQLDVAVRGDGNGTDKPGIMQRLAILENAMANMKRLTLSAGGVLVAIITAMCKKLLGLPS